MPGLHSPNGDGLLVLLQAAQELEDKQSKFSWESGRPYSRTTHHSESKLAKDKKSQGSRCSHNELEKRRRGYLKHCMEQLKERLDFKNETARITTLSVLKKAKNEILNTNDDLIKFEALIKKENLRTQSLSKRKFQIKKRLDDRSSRRTPSSWRERNRNYSECSVATTSSEESELDYYARQSSRNGNQSVVGGGGGGTVRSLTPQLQRSTTSMLPPRKTNLSLLRPMVSINTSPMKSHHHHHHGGDMFMDGSSSDSGYEEISSLTPPGTSECLSPMDLSAANPGKMIAKANQLMHQQATYAVLQGTAIPSGGGGGGGGGAMSYWNNTVF